MIDPINVFLVRLYAAWVWKQVGNQLSNSVGCMHNRQEETTECTSVYTTVDENRWRNILLLNTSTTTMVRQKYGPISKY